MDSQHDQSETEPPADDELERTETGIDPVQELLQQRHPRIRLYRQTVELLPRAQVATSWGSLQDFCNDAIRYVILSGEAATVSYSDLQAVSAALDARLDELNVILLHLHQAVADLSLLVEQRRIIGAYAERLRQLESK